MRHPRGRAIAGLVVGLAVLAWSAAMWAASEAPWWAPVVIGVATSLHIIVGHYLDKKKSADRSRLARAEKERRAAERAKEEAERAREEVERAREELERRERELAERVGIEHRVATRAVEEARRERARATAAERRAQQAERDATAIIEELDKHGLLARGDGHAGDAGDSGGDAGDGGAGDRA
jgi:membrane protein involved in colicin uptake